MADSHEVERWKNDLSVAGWTTDSFINWRAPDGSLWRGPYGAWKELQRRKEYAAMTTTNPTPTQQETLEGCPFCPAELTPLPSAHLPADLHEQASEWYQITHNVGCYLLLLGYGNYPIHRDRLKAWNTRRAAVAGPRGDAQRDLEAIIIRCEDGDPSVDWRPTITRLANHALKSLAPHDTSKLPTFRTTKEAMLYAQQHQIPTVIPVTAAPADNDAERYAQIAEKMYGPHDRRFKVAIEIADAIRRTTKGDR